MCGHAGPALNDILALDHFIGFTELMVIHHTGKFLSSKRLPLRAKEKKTPQKYNPSNNKQRNATDCGSLAFTDDQVRETLRKRQPNDEKSIASMKFGTIKE